MKTAIVTDRFISLSSGCAPLLRTCDFIDRYQARILDISESTLLLTIGNRWSLPWIRTFTLVPVRVTVQILPQGELTPEQNQWIRAQQYCTINVTIEQGSIVPRRTSEFEETARQLIRSLRHCLLAC